MGMPHAFTLWTSSEAAGGPGICPGLWEQQSPALATRPQLQPSLHHSPCPECNQGSRLTRGLSLLRAHLGKGLLIRGMRKYVPRLTPFQNAGPPQIGGS